MAELVDIGDLIVGWADDGEQVEAFVIHERETEVRAYGGEVESLSSAEAQGVGIRVIRDQRQGFAYAGTLDADALEETLAEARDNATFGTVDEFLGLAEPDSVAPPALDLFNTELAAFPTDGKVDLAIALEKATLAADPRISGIESAEYVDSIVEVAVVSTTGIRMSGQESSCYLSVYSMAEADGDTQTGFGFSVTRDPADLDVDAAAREAADRATRLLGATKPHGERLTVVLDPFVTAQFLGIIGYTMSGEAVLKGRSLFADRLGEVVASPSITLVDDPTNPAAFTATEADGEGLATRRIELISNGTLNAFAHNSYTARRAGTVSTASAVRGYSSTPSVGVQAISLVPGHRSPEALIAEVDNGLLVQGVSGLHSGVNPVSGDFSTGAEGLRIRNGSVAEPVREITIASTLQRMLTDVVAVGNDIDWLPMNAAGVTLVVSDVMMSGA